MVATDAAAPKWPEFIKYYRTDQYTTKQDIWRLSTKNYPIITLFLLKVREGPIIFHLSYSYNDNLYFIPKDVFFQLKTPWVLLKPRSYTFFHIQNLQHMTVVINIHILPRKVFLSPAPQTTFVASTTVPRTVASRKITEKGSLLFCFIEFI